jgi:hypothetical protein
MSLTQEQHKDLDRINEVFRKIEKYASAEGVSVDELGEEFITFGHSKVDPDRTQMNKLAEERAQILALQKAFNKGVTANNTNKKN